MTNEVMESHRELDQPAHDSLAPVLTTTPNKPGVGNLSANCLLCALPTNPHCLSHPAYFQSFLISYTFIWNKSTAWKTLHWNAFRPFLLQESTGSQSIKHV